MKNYHFDIKKNCKSFKELEKMLEITAVEISDEFKKQALNNKRSHVKSFFTFFYGFFFKEIKRLFFFNIQTITSIKSKNNSEKGQWKSSDNITARSDPDKSRGLNFRTG